MLYFREWFASRDIFGFDKDEEPKSKPIEEEMPIQKFDLEGMMGELMRISQRDPKPPFMKFSTEIQWGTQPGALRVIISPKFHAVFQRLAIDKEGTPTWVCKKVFSINIEKFRGKEDIVASEIHEVLQSIEKEQLDHGEKFEIGRLAEAMAANLKKRNQEVFYFQELKRVSKNEYAIALNLRGAGVGRLPGARRSRYIRQYIISVSFNEAAQSIKVFMYPVSDQDEGSSWEVLEADFYQYFFPTQPKSDIIDAVITSLNCY